MEKQEIQDIADILHNLKHLERQTTARRQKAEGHGYVLYYLQSHGGHAFPGELCQDLQVSTPRVTAILDVLERDGMIERSVDTNDRRKVLIRITEQGLATVEKHQKGHLAYITKLTALLGDEDAQALKRILATIYTAKRSGEL